MIKHKSGTGYKLYSKNIIHKEDISLVDQLNRVFSVKVPEAYTLKITEKNAADPIWKTVIPSIAELEIQNFDLKDPIGDFSHSPVKGIVHRYRDRVLLMPTNICAMYCRFCFRRNVVGKKSNLVLNTQELETALTYIGNHTEIWEVIFSGGDPFTLSNGKIAVIIDQLLAMDHVKVIRFHTRILVAKPSRIDYGLMRLFKRIIRSKKAVYFVAHINHLREIDEEVEAAAAKMINIGVPVLNQSVLLKDINDSAASLEALLRKLVEIRIKPYYLHHLDLTEGTDHFRVPIAKGQQLIKELRFSISGLCLPQYMLDLPGGYGKVPLETGYYERDAGGKYIFEGMDGHKHEYPSL